MIHGRQSEWLGHISEGDYSKWQNQSPQIVITEVTKLTSWRLSQMVPIAKTFQFVLSSALDGHRTLFTGYNALLCSLGRSTEDLVDQGLRQRGRCSRDGVGSVVQQRERKHNQVCMRAYHRAKPKEATPFLKAPKPWQLWSLSPIFWNAVFNDNVN